MPAKKFQLARYFKRLDGGAYDRKDACQCGVWLHTWHRDAKRLQRVVRTKYPTEAAAKKAFRAFCAEHAGYEQHEADGNYWTINTRGLRGYRFGGKTWGWPQKWSPDVSVKIVKL